MGWIKMHFYQYICIIGYRCLTVPLDLTSKTKQYNKKRIRRLMVKQGLKSYIRRSHGYCTKTSYKNIEENHLNHNFKADRPNQKWVTDITHLHYGNGQKVYLSVVKDLYDGSIIVYRIGKRNMSRVGKCIDNGLIESFFDISNVNHIT